MTATLTHVHGVSVLHCPADGPLLAGEAEALDLIGEALGQQADVVTVPVERLPEEFFRLASGVAGAVVQKFGNYRLRLVVVGDISAHLAASQALRDFVRETNRGGQVWFVSHRQELTDRLQPR